MGLTRRVALIDMTGHIEDAYLAKVAAAIDLQVRRDLSRYWPMTTIVSTLPSPLDVPPGVWPVYIVSRISDSIAGFHTTSHYQPYAEIEDDEGWSLAASHEIIEMLTDPSGNALVAGRAVQVVDGAQADADGVVEYLLEICDPCQEPECAYMVDGILVSDFCTPEFYDDYAIPGARYSFSGKIAAPRQVLPGSYMSWWNSEKHMMERFDFTDPASPPAIVEVGLHPPNECLREHVDKFARKKSRIASVPPGHPVLAAQQRHAASIRPAARARGDMFRRNRK